MCSGLFLTNVAKFAQSLALWLGLPNRNHWTCLKKLVFSANIRAYYLRYAV